MYAFARLKPGVTAQGAKAALDGIYRNILSDVEAPLQVGMSDETMARFKAREVTVTGGSQGQSQLRASVSTPLVLLMVVAGVVLLVACANIANLLLVRSAGRTGEMAVRLSVGGSRGQIVRQLLTESAVLAAAGGLAGVFVARWTLAGVATLLPENMASMVGPTVGTPAIVFAMALWLVTGLAAGLLPAIHGTRPDLASTLKSQAGQPSGARAAARFRTTLATAQIGLAMALLVAAGLFTRSLINVSQVDLGMDVDHVLTFGLAPGFNGYDTDRTRTFIERAEADLSALPGVTSASASLIRVLSGNSNGGNLRVEGFDAGPDTNVNVRLHQVGADFFRTLRMPVLAGRFFSDADADAAPKVALVNESFARKFNLGSNPIGKRLSLDRRAATLDTEIVGFVRDAKYSAVKQDVPAVLFLPYRQEKELFGAFFYARTSVPPESVMSSIAPLAANLDPDVPVWSLKLLEQEARENIFLDRLIGVLSASFAGLATLLAAIGLYGVLAYTIAQRTREIGLRMALGADAARVRGMILGQVARMAAVGGGAGLVVAIGIGLWAQSLLFELDGHDPAVIAAAVVILGAVALFAGFVPARRASRIEPMRALKWE